MRVRPLFRKCNPSSLTRSILVGLLLLIPACGRHGALEAGEVVTINYWNGFTGPDGKTMERMVRNFESENRDVRVNMQIIPWAQYYEKLTLGIAFHQAPDLFICP